MSSSGKRRKTGNNRTKKEAEKRTDEKEATKLDQRHFKNECGLLYKHITLYRERTGEKYVCSGKYV